MDVDVDGNGDDGNDDGEDDASSSKDPCRRRINALYVFLLWITFEGEVS
jgi:hypothetical protein